MSNLETELSAALVSDSISAVELNGLIVRTQTAITEADADAKRQNERVFDPQLCADPKEARDAMDNALLLVGRLNTLLTRLHRKRTAAESSEHLATWEIKYKELKEERDALVTEMRTEYPAAAATLIDLFTRIADCDTRLGRLNQAAPSGVKSRLVDVELEVRGLERFTRSEPAIAGLVHLYDLHTAKQIWPPVTPRDMSIFAPAPYNPRYSGEWHKYRDEEADARRRESERVFQHYDQMAKERAAREHAEDMERWKNVGGAGK